MASTVTEGLGQRIRHKLFGLCFAVTQVASVFLFAFGAVLPMAQIFFWIAQKKWIPVTLLDILVMIDKKSDGLADWQWLYSPDAWLWAHGLFKFIPLSLACVITSAIIFLAGLAAERVVGSGKRAVVSALRPRH